MTRRWRLLLSLLLMVAALGLSARLFSLLAVHIPGHSGRYPRAAVRLNPLDPANKRRLGTSWLAQGKVDRGIAWLERSLRGDPFSSDTWLALARAHLTRPALRQRYFERGIAELRTAARLGPGRPQLSIAVGMELLRLWPFLDQEARQECRQRLSRGIAHMDPLQVDDLVRGWYRYSRSWELLASVLDTCPDACDRVARRMLDLGAFLEWRWRLLAAIERRRYAGVRSRFEDMEKRGLSLPDLEPMIASMDTIRGYARLVDARDMDWRRFQEFRENLLYKGLERALILFRLNPREKQRALVMAWARRVIRNTRTINLEDISLRMEELGVWRTNEPESRIMRIRLELSTGDHASALEQAQQLLPALQKDHRVQVGLLAIRAAMAVRLLTSARLQVDDVLRQDPGNREALWRRAQIHLILGEDVPPADRERLQNDAILELGRRDETAAIRLPMIEGVRAGVRVPEAVPGTRRLLQVYLDHAVLLEKYLDTGAQTIWLDVPVSTDLEPMPELSARIVPLDAGSDEKE